MASGIFTGYGLTRRFLEETSLSLVMRDARNDGRCALKILREHYAGRSKPRIITELRTIPDKPLQVLDTLSFSLHMYLNIRVDSHMAGGGAILLKIFTLRSIYF